MMWYSFHMWTRTSRSRGKGECGPWDVHVGPAGGSRGPRPSSTALGAVKDVIKVQNPQLFQLFIFINLSYCSWWMYYWFTHGHWLQRFFIASGTVDLLVHRDLFRSV